MYLWVFLVYEWNALAVWVIGVQSFPGMANAFYLTCQHQYICMVCPEDWGHIWTAWGKVQWLMDDICHRTKRSMAVSCEPGVCHHWQLLAWETEKQDLTMKIKGSSESYSKLQPELGITCWLPQVILELKKIKSRCLVKSITKQETASCNEHLLFLYVATTAKPLVFPLGVCLYSILIPYRYEWPHFLDYDPYWSRTSRISYLLKFRNKVKIHWIRGQSGGASYKVSGLPVLT